MGGCGCGCPGACGCGCPGACGMMPGMMGMRPGMPGMAGNPMMMQMMMMNMMNMQQMMAKGGDKNNPMAAMMGGMGAMGMPNPMAAAAEEPKEKDKPLTWKEDDEEIDPDVRELGDYFNIEERWVVRLNEAMKKRTETKAQDIEKLYEVLEKARSPTGLLTVQIGKMECGQFVGKIKPDKDVERMARKFKLDDPVTSRLTELKVWRKRNGEEDRATKDLERIEYHLRFAKRPNALCTLLVGKLLEGEVDELPDLTKAEKVMTDYKLDEDACCKMREIIEKRVHDEDAVLTSVRKHLNTASNASSMLCKIARQLMDGEILPDPPERPPKGAGKGKDKDKDGDKGDKHDKKGDKHDKHDRDRRERRSRSRDRDRKDRDRRERRDSRDR